MCPHPGAVPAERLARDRYDASVPIGDWKPRRAQRWPSAVLGVAASCALVALIFAFWRTPAETNASGTAIGENRSVTLADGSIVALGGAFRLQPLRYVLEDVNRYAHKPIVLEAESMGTLVADTVERENVGGWVKGLEHAFDLQVTEEADQIVLRAR